MFHPIPRPEELLNRELSWLDFNARVMEEAEDPSVPLLERVKRLRCRICSSSRAARCSEGCEIDRARAAALNEASSATAISAWSCDRLMRMISDCTEERVASGGPMSGSQSAASTCATKRSIRSIRIAPNPVT